jgi:adenine-specific DNA-methyltransferase
MDEENTKIIKHLKDILKKFNNKYIVNDTLKKSNVINALNNYDAALIGKLMDDPLIRDNYVININGNNIFEINKLVSMFEYKEYWENSYTQYSNSIGLTADNKFIHELSDVVLDFPFKDCVLKGQADSENDEGNNEQFLNEVIARPEIDEMLEPKIFNHVVKYDTEGTHNVERFSSDDNLIIKGNNLIALYSLKKQYAHKIKLIYLDPPYNTGNDSFEYNDRFNHAAWLTFMKNRLEIAKELLTDDGSIWISIDSHESHYLKVLADSVLGRQNFVDEITWQRAYAPVNLKKTVSRSTDSILIYANHFDGDFSLNKLPRSVEANSRYKNPDNDPRGPWKNGDLSVGPAVEKNIYKITTPSGREVMPPKGYSWRLNKDRLKEFIEDNRIWFGKDGNNVPSIKRFLSEVNGGVVSQTLWTYQEVGHNQDAKREIKALFGDSAFGTPKPEKLIQRIITMATDENDLVLDFFMGSATTQAVAMKMHRRFIGIEQMNYIKSVSVERLKKVIAGEQGGISEDVNWQGGGSFVYAELMEKNQKYLNKILKATNVSELDNIYNQMKDTDDLDFRVDLSLYENTKDEHNFAEQKQLLTKMLDKNQLYSNYSEIDDQDVKAGISSNDYNFNRSFYDREE